MIIHYIILLILPLLISLLITPLIRQTAIKSSALDPPCERKIHRCALPRLGGIAIAIAFFFSISIGYILLIPEKNGNIEALAGLSIGAAIIAFVGILDDVRGLNASKKSIGQLASALAILPFGFIVNQINIPFLGVIYIGNLLGALLTVFWVMGIINAINFIDGIDGLAGIATLIILGTLFITSYISNQIQMVLACIVLAGAVIGFLRYNLHKATIFMGDCGAMLLGFITSVITIKVLFQSPTIVASSAAPILIFGLPIVDATWAILRRFRKGRSPFSADLGHLHHRLLNLGFSQGKALLILGLAGFLMTSSGLVIVLLKNEILSAILCISMLIIALALAMLISRISPTYDQLQNNGEIESKSDEVPI